MARVGNQGLKHWSLAALMLAGLFLCAGWEAPIKAATNSPPADIQLGENKLVGTSLLPGARFGSSVGISDDQIIIGAYGENSAAGAAYIFKYDGMTWVKEAQLFPSDGSPGGHFGFSVATFGDRVIVGAKNDDDNGSYSGAAYIFRWNGTAWIQETKLLPSDGSSGDYFG
ncbi:MAG: hypothetical protein V1918_08755, partial [Planctomycetota bacterium]